MRLPWYSFWTRETQCHLLHVTGKKQHGTMDDQTIRMLSDRLNYLRGLENRQAEVKNSIEEQGKLTPELAGAIDAASTLAEVDDLYQPYRPQKADQGQHCAGQRGWSLWRAAVFGRRTAVTRWFWQRALQIRTKEWRRRKRRLPAPGYFGGEPVRRCGHSGNGCGCRCRKTGRCALKPLPKDTVYRLYYEYEEPIRRLQSHRVLAINRGEKEGILKVSVQAGDAEAVSLVLRCAVRPGHPFAALLQEVAEDAWDRLIFPLAGAGNPQRLDGCRQ